MTFDSGGNLFVNNCGANRIDRIASDGSQSVITTGGLLSCPNGLTSDDDDNLYAVNFNNGRIIKVGPDGTASLFATTPGSAFRPSGGNGHIIFANGRLYSTSNATGQVFEITLDGVVTAIAGDGIQGHTDGDGAQARFSFPNGIDISPDGRLLYVNESEQVGPSPLNGNTFNLTPNRLRVIDLELSGGNSGESVNFGMAGGWFDPSRAGQGLLFEPLIDSDQFFAAWFTFESDGTKVGSTEQRWLTMQGPIHGDGAVLEIFNTSGGRFDDPAAVSTEKVGEAEIRFIDCQNATFEYALASGESGSQSLVRIGTGTSCENLGNR